MKLKTLLYMILLTLIIQQIDCSAQIKITLPTAEGAVGREEILNVMVSNVKFMGYQIAIKYDAAVIEMLEPLKKGITDKEGTMSEKLTVFYGRSEGIIRAVGATGGDPIEGEGTLFKIRVKYKKPGRTVLTLDEKFNNKFAGNLPFTVEEGSITVSNHKTHKLDINSKNGKVEKNPDMKSYIYGSEIVLTAKPNKGYKFIGWNGDAKGNANPINVLMNGDKKIEAGFVKE